VGEVERRQEITLASFEGDVMGKKGKKAAKSAEIAAEVERTKKVCSNCGKVGSGGEMNFSKCAFCEFTH